jgi:hypothetical protein
LISVAERSGTASGVGTGACFGAAGCVISADGFGAAGRFAAAGRFGAALALGAVGRFRVVIAFGAAAGGIAELRRRGAVRAGDDFDALERNPLGFDG